MADRFGMNALYVFSTSFYFINSALYTTTISLSHKIHEQKRQASHQAKLVQQYRSQINKIYTKMSHHMISPNQVLKFLQTHGIYSTSEFKRVLSSMQSSEVIIFNNNTFICILNSSFLSIRR